jgi:hypothetical protein
LSSVITVLQHVFRLNEHPINPAAPLPLTSPSLSPSPSSPRALLWALRDLKKREIAVPMMTPDGEQAEGLHRGVREHFCQRSPRGGPMHGIVTAVKRTAGFQPDLLHALTRNQHKMPFFGHNLR